jgi:glycerol-3-phosphate dehydrogenase (NAD(P)+)
MGARPETFAGLAGIGDLVTTCLSRHSRNRHVGEQIGRGLSLQETLASMSMVAEGVDTTRATVELSRRMKIEMPIAEAVHRVLNGESGPRETLTELMLRPLRAETPLPVAG